ncbi:MAG: hypothetical protein COB85_05915, partial [Bacteroidetes bacterium]
HINMVTVDEYKEIYSDLVRKETMLIQPFQKNVVDKGEVAYMIFDGKYTHAVLKTAKQGEFRVQDDFGGTVKEYTPSPEEIRFAEHAAKQCTPLPVYARVDVITDNEEKLAVTEMELIEPELWFRFHPEAADRFANAIFKTF